MAVDQLPTNSIQRMEHGAQIMAPTALWQFLGPTKQKPFVPFPFQLEILDAIRIPWPGLDKNERPYPTIFAVNCGRRSGKTTIGEILMWHGMVAAEDDLGPPVVRLTADTEEHAMKIWRKFIWHMENTPLAGLLENYNREYQLVTFRNGASAQLLSANNPNALSGDGVTLWVVDEAQYLTQAAWVNLFPSTAERNGVIVMLGVSEGEGPFKEASLKGEGSDPAYKRLAYPTAANPLVPAWRIEFARKQLPPTKFRQLYLAQWVGELGKIFRNVRGCTVTDKIYLAPAGYGFIQPPQAGHTYYGGIDLARLQDWTVYTIWDATGKLVAWDRFNLISWELQKKRLAELSKAYGHPTTAVDATGVGDPIYDDLLRLGMNCYGYQITSNEKKRILIDELAVRIGMGYLKYPPIPVLLNELDRMEAKRASDQSLLIKYEAPSGMTDDFVLSCALAQQIVPPPAAVSSGADSQTPARERAAYEYI